MPSNFVVTRIATLERPSLQPLLDESHATGFRFVGKLIDDYESGANRFDQPGEALFGIYANGQMIAIGGLNRDPYSDTPECGRVRRVYVMAAFRRQGVGRILLDAIVAYAKDGFSQLALRTTTAEGAAFYESRGFRRMENSEGQATHLLA